MAQNDLSKYSIIHLIWMVYDVTMMSLWLHVSIEAGTSNDRCWSDLLALQEAGIEGFDCITLAVAVYSGKNYQLFDSDVN
jgi:hypothetical protein